MNGDQPHKRPIRSYVRREGRLTKGQKLALAQLWSKYGLEYTDTQLDFAALFGRSAKRVLEIGFGMGGSLVAMATAAPETDLIGIEVHQPGVGACLLELYRQQINNVRVISHDAVEVLKNMVADESLDVVQIFFPDPWPKRRHHKRRLIQPDFIELIRQKLKPNGLLHLATDWENYAEQMRDVCEENPGFKNIHGQQQFAPTAINRPITKFETRGKKLGHAVFDLQFKKT